MSTSVKVGPFTVRPKIINGKQTGKWLVDIPASLTAGGKRKRKLFDNRKRALDVARELRRRIDPVSGQLIAQAKRSGLTFNQAVTQWQEDEELRIATLKKKRSTFDADLFRLRSLKQYFGAADLASITDRDLAKYQKHRLEQGRKPRTINTELGTLSLVLHWAKKERYIETVPKTENIPARPVKRPVPTPEEAVRILQALPQRLQPLVRFLFETGCRKGEAINLTWDCVDEIGGYVEITSRDGWTPKTQQSERRIPLNDSLLAMIRAMPKEGTYVFPGIDPDTPIGNFRKAFNAAVKAANIRRRGKPVKLTPQSCRRAHATWQAERGVTESVLQGLLGHAKGSKVTKQFYIQVTEEAKKAAVIKLPVPAKATN